MRFFFVFSQIYLIYKAFKPFLKLSCTFGGINDKPPLEAFKPILKPASKQAFAFQDNPRYA